MTDSGSKQKPSEPLGGRMPENDFELVLRSNIQQLLSLANRILKDKSLAEDAVQQAFAKVHSKFHTFQNRSELSTWIHRITVNEALMILRKSKRQKEVPIDELLPSFDKSGCRIEPAIDETKTPEAQLQEQQTRDLVSVMIDKLPENYRVILVLRDIEELSTEEVANLLELSESNVKTRLHRARSALKRLLEPYLKKGEL